MSSMNNRLIIKSIFAINAAKKMVAMKINGVLSANLEHSHTNGLGIILIHRVTRTKYIVNDTNVQVVK